MTTALFAFGYPTSIVVISRWLPVVRERRTAWFVAHEVAVAAIVAGWALKRDPMAATAASWATNQAVRRSRTTGSQRLMTAIEVG